MRKINNRQYKLNQIRGKRVSKKSSVKAKKGRKGDSKLDRRGR
jgi:hypothetical protein